MTVYAGWWEVPDHLMSATALGELEFPRVPAGDPGAWVEIKENWRGKRDSVDLYDVHACPPSKASAGQLVAAHRKSARPRVCEDCDARCQRPLPQHSEDDPRRLCPACRQIARLRARQAELAQLRAQHGEWAAKVLAWEAGAVVQVDLTVPPLSDSGRKRPATAARIRAVDLTGRRLVDVTIRLVGPRARWVPDDAVSSEEGTPKVHKALLGRSLILWTPGEMEALQEAARHETWRPAVPQWRLKPGEQPPERAHWSTVHTRAAQWRGQLDPHHRDLVSCVAPGSPDRLLLLLQRMAGWLYRLLLLLQRMAGWLYRLLLLLQRMAGWL
jgi:hypothetical protein